MSYCQEIKSYPQGYYFDSGRAWVGSFCSRDSGYWIYCREIWRDYIGAPVIYFKHAPGEGKNIANFIARIERRKSLRINVKTKIGRTINSKISWIEVSPW